MGQFKCFVFYYDSMRHINSKNVKRIKYSVFVSLTTDSPQQT